MITMTSVIHDEPLGLEYEVCSIDGRSAVTILLKRQEDGSVKWAVMNGENCLSVTGEWCYESRFPSNRPDNWSQEYRFDDFYAAWLAAKKAAVEIVDEAQRRVDMINAREQSPDRQSRPQQNNV